MMRRVSVVFVIAVCMSLAGCAAMRNMDGSLDKEIKKLKQDREACQRTLQEREGELDQLNRQVSNLNREIDVLKKETGRTRVSAPEEAAGTEGKDRALKEDGIAFEERSDAKSRPGLEGAKQARKSAAEKGENAKEATAAKGAGEKTLKLKVLSGNGKISSAESMSNRLRQLGYAVEGTGLASRSNYRVNTVYYAPDCRKDAQRLAAQLGRGAVAAPLTWKSAFHLIVVTGP